MLKQRGIAANPTYVHSNVGRFPSPTRNGAPNDFIKSKVHELVDDQKAVAPRPRTHTGDEVHHLYQELNHLRNLVPQYEAEIQRLRSQNSGPGLK